MRSTWSTRPHHRRRALSAASLGICLTVVAVRAFAHDLFLKPDAFFVAPHGAVGCRAL